MKKKIICLLMAMMLTVGMIGCGSKGAAVEDTEKAEIKEKDESDKIFQDVPSKEENAEGFGVKNQQYENFNYLQPYEMNEGFRDFVFYLPQNDTYDWAEDDQVQVYGEDQGVGLLFMVNPTIREDLPDYDVTDHTIEENLEGYLLWITDYMVYYNGIQTYEASEITKQGDHGAGATIVYLEGEEDEYTPCFEQYYMFQEEDMLIVSVIMIEPENITDETDALLAEIEEYLGITIEYDESLLDLEPESMEVIGGGDTVYTDFWKMELPMGWAQYDDGTGDYSYSPGGKPSSGANVYVSDMGKKGSKSYRDITEEELGSLAEAYGGNELIVEDYEIVGETPVGYAVKFSLSDGLTYSDLYMIEDDTNVYLVIGMCANGDVRAIEAAEYIIMHAEKIEE